MITSEELYIIRDDERHKVDLLSPSGITLSYESNLFNSLDKVSCNRSYTIRLPKSMNNTRIFDIPQDVRNGSDIPRRKASCEYLVDGVPMFRNGNAYVLSIDEHINICITWDVVEGLQKIKDDNFNINMFDVKEDVETAVVKQKYYNDAQGIFDNYDPVLYPAYHAGVNSIGLESSESDHDMYSYSRGGYMLPVVPVPYLLRRIEDYYGIKINIYSNERLINGMFEKYGEKTKDTIDLGVIPCVSTSLTWKQAERARIRLSSFHIFRYHTPSSLADEVTLSADSAVCVGFNPNLSGGGNDFFSYEKARNTDEYEDTTHGYSYGVTPKQNRNVFVSGVIKIIDLADKIFEWIEDGKPLTMNFYARTRKYYGRHFPERKYYEFENIGSVEGKIVYLDQDEDLQQWYKDNYNVDTVPPNVGKHYAGIVFDMRQQLGFAKLSLETKQMLNIFFTIPRLFEVNLDETWAMVKSSYLDFIPDVQEQNPAHYQDLICNLPEVSCLDFVKGLFYMIGAFPVVRDGEIFPFYYNDINGNIENAEDWSNKVLYDTVETITYSVGNFKKRNKYLMKSDKENEKDEDPTKDYNETEDVYEDGSGVLITGNDSENSSATIVTLPWHPPFIKAKEFPDGDTGDTMKYWKFDSDTAEKALPCYGIMFSEDGKVKMKVWNGFKDICESEGYEWLSKLLSKPLVLSCKVNLNVFDLYELDMSKPVYIERYNSYFCKIKVERSSDGLCSAELLRIPPEAL